MALIVASALGCLATVGLTATPAMAAVTAPTDLKAADQPCATAAPGPYLSPARLNMAQAVVLKGSFSGAPDGAELQADFQVWDVADPEHPQEWLRDVGDQSDQVYVQLEDDAKQLDGVTYAWRVRVLGAAEPSPWSGTCYFTVDRSGGPAPTVASTDYPAGSWDEASGAIGVPGVFRLTSASPDTVSYLYRFGDTEPDDAPDESTVAAEGLGGPATVRWAPRTAQNHTLRVYAIDRAGNRSEPSYYDFYVKETRPAVWSAAYPDLGANLDYNVGVPGAFELTATVVGTVSFAWRIDADGPSGTVPVGADRQATTMIAPARAGRQTLHVHSVTADGRAHAPRAYQFLVDNGPTVTSDTNGDVTIGSSRTFHLVPRAPQVEAYLYWPEYSSIQERPVVKTTVPARADGTADFTWTAVETGIEGLRMQSRSADGTLSEPRWYGLRVDGAEPTVTRTGGTEVGMPATFTARTRMADVAAYEVTMNGDEGTKRILEPAADGSVTFEYTMTKVGYNYLSVVARNASGVRTEQGGESWSVTNGPRVTSTDFPTTGSGRLATGTFNFTPRLSGTVRYEYSVNFGPAAVLAARPDGSATLTWTPPGAGTWRLDVVSVTASGNRSMSTAYGFRVAVGAATVSSVSPATVAPGGLRIITLHGTGLHPRDEVQVAPSSGPPVNATVQAASADGTTMTVEVPLAAGLAGPVELTLRPYGSGQLVVLANAFTIVALPALGVVVPPTITGTPAVGGTVTASPGEWAPSATAHRYQWSADGTVVEGATGATFTIPPGLLGVRLTVRVTASRAGHASAEATSASTAVIAKGQAPRATKLPTITGTPRLGETVRADVGVWAPTPDSFRVEWRVNGKLISSGPSTLKLTPAMRDKQITLTVITKKAGYVDGRSTSAAVTVRA